MYDKLYTILFYTLLDKTLDEKMLDEKMLTFSIIFFDRISRIHRFFFVCDKILPKAKNPVNPVNPVKKHLFVKRNISNNITLCDLSYTRHLKTIAYLN